MFRSLRWAAAVAILLMLNSGGASAQVIVSDGFDYAPGAITGQGGGVGWANNWTSGSSTNPDLVTSGGLTFQQNGVSLAVSGNSLTTVGSDIGAYRRVLPGGSTDGGDVNQDLWISFLAAGGGTTPTADTGLALYQDNVGETFFLGVPAGSGEYGLQNKSLPGPDGAAQTTGTAADTATHFLVAHLSFTASGSTEATLYVDPTPGMVTQDEFGSVVPLEDPALDENYEYSFQFDEFGLASGASSDDVFQFDELRMGNTYLDVAPAAAPEPSGLVILAVGCLGMGVCARRRSSRRMV